MTNQNSPEQNYYQEDEIDLKQLFRSLADRKWFIFGFTSFITVLALAYALSIAPTYKAHVSFLAPSQSSVLQLNKIKLTSETSETIYRKFLNKAMSSQFQRKIFDKYDYLSKLNPENKPIENLEAFFADFSKSINLEERKVKKNVAKISYEKPVNISIEGDNPQVISSFLNTLTKAADQESIDEFVSIIQQKIAIRLEEIVKQRGLLLAAAKQDRLSNIKRIKIEDIRKINEINDQIDRLRVKAKQDRINKIKILTDTAKMASALGVKENNFKKISNNKNDNSTLTVSVGDNQKLPKWYLYGESALTEEINLLKNRVSDDAYTSEIVNLNNKLSTVRSNQILKTLESRQDDSPYVAVINKLDIEAIKLKSFKPSSIGIHAVQINQHAYAPQAPIKPNKRLIVAVAFIAGFILSIFLVFIMNAFRPEKQI